jgi:hypothetical protein
MGRPKRWAPAVLASLTLLVAHAARAADPATDIGVLPPSQPQPQPEYRYQPQPQGQPQPQYQPQPAQQAQPAPVYPPYPPPYSPYAPRTRRYRDGDPIPPGYHVEEEPRNGLVVGGAVMFLVPYAIGGFAALAADLKNDSGWLLAPVVGPWLTLGKRTYNGCDRSSGTAASDSLGCVGDIFLVMGLVIDGVLQVTGATLFTLGYLVPRETLVRDGVGLHVLPTRVGTGYGLGLHSTF